MSLRTSWAVALVAVSLGAGCGDDEEESAAAGGGGGSEEAAVLETVTGFNAAVLEGDGETACGLLSEDATAAIEAGASGAPEGVGCVELIELTPSLLEPEDLEVVEQELADNPPEVLSVSGDTATAESPSFNKPDESAEVEVDRMEFELERIEGDWKIAGFPDPRG